MCLNSIILANSMIFIPECIWVTIGTSDKLYLYQMEALTDPIMGFNRYEKRLQPVTKQWSIGN